MYKKLLNYSKNFGGTFFFFKPFIADKIQEFVGCILDYIPVDNWKWRLSCRNVLLMFKCLLLVIFVVFSFGDCPKEFVVRKIETGGIEYLTEFEQNFTSSAWNYSKIFTTFVNNNKIGSWLSSRFCTFVYNLTVENLLKRCHLLWLKILFYCGSFHEISECLMMIGVS